MIPTLVLPDGRRIELDDDIVLGRAPIAPETSPSARSISLSSPTVSKTHVLVGHDSDGVWLVDLDSSNGSEVLDDHGMSERAVPGQRMTVPEGAHLRVGTDTIITIDSGTPPAEDDLDRTMVVRPAPVSPEPPSPPTIGEVSAPADPVDWSSVTDPQPPPPVVPEPSEPAQPSPSQPPPPQPPPPHAQPSPSQPPPSQPPPPHAQPAPSQPPPPTEVYTPTAYPADPPVGQPGSVAGYAGASAASSPTEAGRSTAHLAGGLLLLVWSAVGFAQLRGWVPDTIASAADGRLLDFFFVPDRFTLEFFEFYSFISLPDSLSFLARVADVVPAIAVLLAAASLIAPTRVLRWMLVALVAIPVILAFGIVVSLLVDSFDFFIDDIDRFIPWFVLPTIGSALVLWPRRQSAPPPQNVIYAPGQPPESPMSGPGAPPFA